MCLHRRPRAEQGRISGAFLAFACGPLRGPTHSYVRMPFGLPSVASAYQCNVRQVLAAQESRFHAVLEEMVTAFREPLEPPEPPEAQGPGGS